MLLPTGMTRCKHLEKKTKIKDYGYKCHEDPMCNHCDKKLCATRKYGIGKQKIFPQLSGLQKLI